MLDTKGIPMENKFLEENVMLFVMLSSYVLANSMVILTH